MKLASLSNAARTFGVMVLLTVMVGTTAQQSTQAQDTFPGSGTLALNEDGICLAQNIIYQEFGGITLSPEQQAAYRELEARSNARLEAITANTKIVENASVWTPEQIAEGQRIGRELEAQTMALLTPEQRPIYQANLEVQRRIQACTQPIPFDRILSPRPYVQQSAQVSMSGTSKSNVAATRPAQSSQTILDIAAANPDFSTLVTAVKAAGLTRTLSGNIPITVFAPTNEAFAALPKGTLERLLRPENRATLRKVLTYHFVSGAVESTSALRAGFAGTVEGNPVAITGNRNQIRVDNATVVSADVKASNGVIHVIDRVLLPPDLR
ncbi:fasciclin domain-containing protein [Leptolyngbya sp. AN03gr2]|uniref:fasciclin domain-containing protein n=1 Tax=unclassified Leptolyngbya TaxID=2650499 RepID=UPI003D314D53